MFHVHDVARARHAQFRREAAEERMANEAVPKQRIEVAAVVRNGFKAVVEAIVNAAQRRVF